MFCFKYLASRLFEIVEDFPLESQRQLIKALPDLLLDEESQTLASFKLCELYESRSELSGAVLEALGAIRVPEDQVADVSPGDSSQWRVHLTEALTLQ